MVVGDRFAWGHIPRTSGDAARTYFLIAARQNALAVTDYCNHKKHDPFYLRPECAGKDLILNIRRLPSFLLSWAAFIAKNGIYPDGVIVPFPANPAFTDKASGYAAEPLYKLGLWGPFATLPDRYLALFAARGAEVKHWLRAESLQSDFFDVMTDYLDLSGPVVEEVAAATTKTPLDYDHDVWGHFTRREVGTMYANNPRWAAVELKVYGSLL